MKLLGPVRELDDPPLEAQVEYFIGSRYARIGLHKEAVDHLQKAQRVAESVHMQLLAGSAAAGVVRDLLFTGARRAPRSTPPSKR